MTTCGKKSALRDRLQPGEIFTIEPMIRFTDDHTGMRIEDTLRSRPPGSKICRANLPEDRRDTGPAVAIAEHKR